jgi:hypothetical protein
VTGGPSGGLFSAFAATTEAEAAMAAAVAAGDQIAYLKALSGESLVLPITPEAAAGREPVRFATSEAFGVKYVLAFTSGPALPPHVEHVRRAPLFEIVHAVADLGWGLAVDPGLSLQSFLAPEAVRDLKAWEPVWTPLDFALRKAVEADDRDAYMAALLEGSLVLPLPTDEELALDGDPEPVAAAPAGYWTAVPSDQQPSAVVSRDVTDPEFPWWRTERVDGVPLILAFTSVAHLQAELGDRDWIVVGFIEIVASWPEEGFGLRLNPGGTNGMELPAEALRAMYDLFLAAMSEKNRRPDE